MADKTGQKRAKGETLLIARLAAGATFTEAAKAAGVDERTVRRRWAEPEFRREVSAVRGELISSAVGRLSRHATKAVDVLAELMESAESETVRLSAARAVLTQVQELRSHTELEDRIAALEAAQPLRRVV